MSSSPNSTPARIRPSGRRCWRANGGTTFPQIFIDGFHVGGCDELYALEGAGKLDELLNGQKEPT